jgi:hypothetical protein
MHELSFKPSDLFQYQNHHAFYYRQTNVDLSLFVISESRNHSPVILLIHHAVFFQPMPSFKNHPFRWAKMTKK